MPSQCWWQSPALAAHVLEAALPHRWSAGLADQVGSLSSLTDLTLPAQDPVLGQAGMMDALRQLSGLQSLSCLGSDLQTLLAKSVPHSWSLLTKLKLFPGITRVIYWTGPSWSSSVPSCRHSLWT